MITIDSGLKIENVCNVSMSARFRNYYKQIVNSKNASLYDIEAADKLAQREMLEEIHVMLQEICKKLDIKLGI